MRKMVCLAIPFLLGFSSYGQKEVFDVVSYTVPKGWTKEMKENGVQLYNGDSKTGEYAVAVIVKSTAGGASPEENFAGAWCRGRWQELSYRYVKVPAGQRLVENFTKNFDFGAVQKMLE